MNVNIVAQLPCKTTLSDTYVIGCAFTRVMLTTSKGYAMRYHGYLFIQLFIFKLSGIGWFDVSVHFVSSNVPLTKKPLIGRTLIVKAKRRQKSNNDWQDTKTDSYISTASHNIWYKRLDWQRTPICPATWIFKLSKHWYEEWGWIMG